MSQKSVLSNLVKTFIIIFSLYSALMTGVLTANNTELVMFLFPVIFFVYYIFAKANEIKLPFYFFVGLILLISNNLPFAGETTKFIGGIGIFIVFFVCLVNIALSIKNKLPLRHERGYLEYVRDKYRRVFAENSGSVYRVTAHSAILFITACIGYLLRDHHGFWVIVSAGAVLIGDHLDILKKRGINRVYGILIGVAIAGIIVLFNLNIYVRIGVFIISFIIAIIFMPKVEKNPRHYIWASGAIGMTAMLGMSFSAERFTWNIIIERLICGTLGVAITILLCFIFNRFISGIYHYEASSLKNV